METPASNRRRKPGLIPVLVIAIAAAVLGSLQVRKRMADDGVGAPGSASSPSPIAPVRPAYDPARWPATAAGLPAPPVAVVAHGATLYAAHCASCHGANLEGQPDWKLPLPDGSLPAPPHDITGHTWHHGDGELLQIIAKGGVVYMPESKMPGYAKVLSDDDMRAVLTFIKTSWGAEQLQWQAQITAGEVGPQAAP